MPARFTKRSWGFAWLPVLVVVALVGLLIPTVKYVTNPDVSFDIRKLASEVINEGGGSRTGTTGTTTTSPDETGNPRVSPLPTASPTVSPSPSATPLSEPACIPDGDCLSPTGDCCTGHSYADYSCIPTDTRCGTQVVQPSAEPSAVPIACAAENEMPSLSKPCCAGLVAVASPYGYYCAKPGDCTLGATKCQEEFGTHYIYTCGANGYYTKTKRCDFGCSNGVCLTVCSPGQTRCEGDILRTCSSDGSAWGARSCPYGCESTSAGAGCKSTPVSSPSPSPSPSATPTPASAVASCLPDGSCIGPKDCCQSGNSYYDLSCAITETRCGQKPYCSPRKITDCPYGCEPTSTGGVCKTKPAETAVSAETETKGLSEEDLIALGRLLNTITFGAFGNYVSTQVEKNQQYGYGTESYDYWARVADIESLASAARLGTTLTAEGAAAYFGASALPGVYAAAGDLAVQGLVAIETTPTLATLTQITGTALGTSWLISSTAACLNDPGSELCASLLAGNVADPQMLAQLGASWQSLGSRALSYIDEVASVLRLPGNNPADWSYGTYGVQTPLAHMPEGLSPGEEALWLAENQLSIYRTYYQGAAEEWTNVGYQRSSASEVFTQTPLTEALRDLSDPTGYVAYMDELASQGLPPQGLVDAARGFIEQNNVLLLETPPAAGAARVVLPDGSEVYWPFQEGDLSYGLYRSGSLPARGVSSEGTPFAFPSSWQPEGYILNRDPTIFLNRANLDSSNQELKTLTHEFGHYIEEQFSQPVLATFGRYDQELDRLVMDVTEAAMPATEYTSSLYGIRAAQWIAPASLNTAYDLLLQQVLLNRWITGGW
jgi:hypothetical protein